MNADGLESAFIHYVFRLSPFALIVHFAFTDEAQRHVGQLYQVTAGTHTAVFGNVRAYTAVDELGEQRHQFGVHTAFALCERAYACQHTRAYKNIVQGFTHTGGMGANDVILQFTQVRIFHTPLCHRTKAGVDAVDHLVTGEAGQKIKTIGYALQRSLVPHQLTISVQDVTN